MDCTFRIAKTKALISCAFTAQLICVFVFAYSKSLFSHNEARNYVKLYPALETKIGNNLQIDRSQSIKV